MTIFYVLDYLSSLIINRRKFSVNSKSEAVNLHSHNIIAVSQQPYERYKYLIGNSQPGNKQHHRRSIFAETLEIHNSLYFMSRPFWKPALADTFVLMEDFQ
jgi:hypothetical protein